MWTSPKLMAPFQSTRLPVAMTVPLQEDSMRAGVRGDVHGTFSKLLEL